MLIAEILVRPYSDVSIDFIWSFIVRLPRQCVSSVGSSRFVLQ